MATILVVDDHPDNRAFLVTLLAYKGHRLFEAADGAEALATARAERPDLVIADILMPTMDGYELVRQLRADPAVAPTPVIFYTAHFHEREAHGLARNCGVHHVLTKPSDPEVVLRTVEEALGLTALPPAPPAAESFDREHLRLLTDKLSLTVEELQANNLRLAALINMGLQLASERDPRHLLGGFCRAARELIGARYAVVGVVEQGADALRDFFTSGIEEHAVAGLDLSAPRGGVLGELLAERRPRRLRRLPSDSPPPIFPPQQGIGSFLGAPVVSPMRTYGWVCLADKLGADEFTDEDERQLAILAALTGRVYENGKLAAEARERAARLEQEVAERQRAEDLLAERVRLAGLVADVGLALTQGLTLRDALQRCAEAIVGRLEVAFARIWTLNDVEQILELQASAGMYTHIDGPHSRVPVGRFKIGLIAKERTPHLTNNVLGDPRVRDQEWAWREGMVAFAGHPLIVGDRVLGVMALFARRPLSKAIPEALAAIADEIALGVERKRAEEALRQGHGLLRAVTEGTTDAVYVKDLRGCYLMINTAGARLLGKTVEDVLGKDDASLLAAEVAPKIIEDDRRVMATGEMFVVEEEFRVNGVLRTFLSIKGPYRDDGGRVIGIIGISHDITDRKSAEEALRDSEARYRFLFERNLAGVMLTRGDGAILDANDAAARIFGIGSRDELLGRRMPEFYFDPADRLVLTESAVRQRSVTGREVRFRRADGQPVWALINISHLHDSPDGPVFHSTLFDISDWKRAEETLRLRDRAIRAVTQGILITDPALPDNPIIYASPGFEQLTGFAQAEALGRNCRFLQGPQSDPAIRLQVREAVRDGRPCSVEILNYRKDGTSFWNALSISPVRDGEGRLTHFVGVQADVTERRRLEDQYRQAQKMEAIGLLAGGVAHDFNNLLTVISGFGELALERLAQDHPVRQLIRQMTGAGERAAALTRQLLAFSRQQVISPQVLDLNAVLTNLEKMLRRVIGEDIRLSVDLQPDLGRVRADPGQIEQVVMNLAVNARDAMAQGGQLTVETRNVDLGESYTQAHSEARPGRYVLLAVSDTGHGMSPDVRARIWEPFFTTKEKGRGTGLGLATVFGIVKQSGGHVEVYSEPGVGTSFKVYLPRVEEAAMVEKPAPAPAPAPRGTETVLVVEDEAAVQALTTIVLQDSGYTVLAGDDGEQALRIAAQHRGTIHLLVTDVVMPQMGGRELAERLVALHPQMKVLFLSGYTDDAVVRHGILHDKVNFLQKPFLPVALARKVRAVLDTP